MKKATKYPGITQIGKDRYLIRTRVTDPKTGIEKDVKRKHECSLQEAIAIQQQILESVTLTGSQRAERKRVREYATWWLAGKQNSVAPATLRGYADAINLYIMDGEVECGDGATSRKIGDMYLDALNPVDIKNWINVFKTKMAANTVHNTVKVFRMMFDDAKADYGLKSDPFSRVETVLPTKPQKYTKQNPGLLQPPQLAKLIVTLRETEPQWYPVFLAFAFTGLRTGEITALQWDDIDWDTGIITVARSQWRRIVGRPKTEKSAREVELTEELASVLRAHRLRMMREQHPGCHSGWIFPNSVGKLYSNGSFRKPLERALKAANLPRITPHGFRRSFNNGLRKVTSGHVTRSLMGHVTEQMTEHYSFIDRTEKKEAVASLIQLVRQDRPAVHGLGFAFASVNDLLAAVASFYKCPTDAITGNSHRRSDLRARYALTYLAVTDAKLTCPQVGKTLANRSKATVQFIKENAIKLLASDPTFANDLDAIRTLFLTPKKAAS